jgi:low affinity Fe/Cu permease
MNTTCSHRVRFWRIAMLSFALALAGVAHGQMQQPAPPSPLIADQVPAKYPQPIQLNNQRPSGELLARLSKNYDRLEEEKYQPHRVFLTNKQSGWWPGDTEGRTVLSLAMLAQATNRPPKHLEAILALFPERMNKKQYFGDIAPEGIADEQQLSSHGWVLRGLCEHYLMSRDPATLEMINGIVDGLVLAMSGLIEQYPIDPTKREHGGSYSGTRRKMMDNWVLSTDIGCVFIFMDGVIQAYQLTPSQELKKLIDEMIALYNRIDFVAIKAQTHATMTGARGLLRYYAQTGDPALLKKVEEVFATYTREGMTETYENYNWFGRPTHTEPCAIVDSYMVAMQLWRFTGNAEYLDTAQHIYYNGISGTQRANGGFGCNNCAGAEDHLLSVKIEEAHWCCTMRGSEGLARVAQHAYHTKDRDLYVTFHADNAARFQFGQEQLVLRQLTKYPFRGHTTLSVGQSTIQNEITLRMYAPASSENFKVQVNDQLVDSTIENGFLVLPLTPKTGDRIHVSFDLKTSWAKPLNQHTIKGVGTLRYGPLVLATLDPKAKLPKDPVIKHVGTNQFDCSGVPMISVYHLMSEDVKMDGPDRKVMFSKSD